MILIASAAHCQLAAADAGRGEAYRMLDNLQHALADCTQAISLDPTSAWNYADRAETHRLLERTEEAMAKAIGQSNSIQSSPGPIR